MKPEFSKLVACKSLPVWLFVMLVFEFEAVMGFGFELFKESVSISAFERGREAKINKAMSRSQSQRVQGETDLNHQNVNCTTEIN